MTFSERLYIGLQYVLPHHLLSWLARRATQSERRWLKSKLIRTVISRFDVDMSQAVEEDPNAYRSFNAFFTRALKPELRPIAGDADAVVSPCDGRISQFGPIHDDLIVQAKGQHYPVERLLGGDSDLAEQFSGGDFINIYLSPRDYHRLHMPIDGRLLSSTYVPGRLFSVAPLTTAHIPALCARNDRLICHFETPAGPMVYILVGAVMVAGIETVWHGLYRHHRRIVHDPNPPEVLLGRGEEMGRFNMGSTAIMLFARDRIRFDAALANEHALLMGQKIASLTGPSRSPA